MAELKQDGVMQKNAAMYVFFYAARSPFSQWHKCMLKDESGRSFSSCEQYMMYQKALLFGDVEAAASILATNDQKQIKELGRRVRPFDLAVWEREREGIVYRGNLLKFRQNADLRRALFDTAGKQLVEASPYDPIWGIKMDAATAIVTPAESWPGMNLLGRCLDKVRVTLMLEAVGSKPPAMARS